MSRSHSQKGSPRGADGLARPGARASLFQYVSALGYRDFRLFVLGQLITQTGVWMQSVAQAWLVLELTGSSLRLGLVTSVQTLPVLVLSLFAGVVADRLPRRSVLLTTQSTLMLCALALAVLTGTGLVQYWHVLVTALVLGIANTFDMPARHSFMVDLVAPEDTANAVAINSAVFNVTRLVGPALAGILMGLWGPALAFFVTGFSYVGVLGSLFLIAAPSLRTGARVQRGLLSHVREGLEYVRRVPLVGRALVLLGLLSTFAMNTNVLIPVFAQQALHQDATGYGLLMSAMGVGALVGALTLVVRSHQGDPSRSRIAAAFVLSGALIALAFTRLYGVALVVMTAVGWGMVMFNAATNSTLLTSTPDLYRGRVMSLYSLMLVGVAPIGSLLTGAALEALGPSLTALLAGGAGLLSVLAVRPWQDLRSPTASS